MQTPARPSPHDAGLRVSRSNSTRIPTGAFLSESRLLSPIRLVNSFRRLAILLVLAGALHAAPRVSHSKCTTCSRTPSGRIKRSQTAKRSFEKANPCPATGKRGGPCPGYVIDHKRALACGGPDSPGNMQWQTKAAAKAKDKIERKGCTR